MFVDLMRLDAVKSLQEIRSTSVPRVQIHSTPPLPSFSLLPYPFLTQPVSHKSQKNIRKIIWLNLWTVEEISTGSDSDYSKYVFVCASFDVRLTSPLLQLCTNIPQLNPNCILNVCQWISWFLASKGNEYFCEVEEDYILDRFNLTGLNNEVQNYTQALDLITDNFGITDSI